MGGWVVPFGEAVATWCSYKVPTMSRRVEDIHGVMAAVPGHVPNW